MPKDDLVSIIKKKQAQLAKLQSELEDAQTLLASMVQRSTVAARGSHRLHPLRRSAKRLAYSPTAEGAAKILRQAGRPLHAREIAKALKRTGHPVTLGTLVGTLSRWVRSRSVFYRVRPNVFGLIADRRVGRARAADGLGVGPRLTRFVS